jgi:hypothetical protein
MTNITGGWGLGGKSPDNVRCRGDQRATNTHHEMDELCTGDSEYLSNQLKSNNVQFGLQICGLVVGCRCLLIACEAFTGW